MLQKTLAPLTRLFFQLLYYQFAWTYDLVAAVASLGHWQDWVRSLTPELTGPAILELGHGPGHLQQTLLGKHDIQVFGIDRSRQMGAIARNRLKKAGFHPNLVQADAQRTPFASHSFQQIVATFPTEYIVSPDTISEITRLLKPGGELLILPSARLTGSSPLHRLIEWLYEITGQAGEPLEELSARGLENYSAMGYGVEVTQRDFGHSQLTVIRLTRKD